MSLPDAPTIAVRRQRVLVMIRASALALAVLGACIGALITQARIGRYAGWEFLGLPVAVVFTGFWGPAAALAVGGRRLARWLVPAPSLVCPRCEYPLPGAIPETCPECGQRLRAPGETAAVPSPRTPAP